MNKTININLGGRPFIIDEDAFKHLDAYLQAIRKHFSKSEGYEEIVEDIEARMAELFEEFLGGRGIVSMREVKNAVSVMGTPEDFGMEEGTYAADDAATDSASDKTHSIKTGKRLFRDPDDKQLGGVCSGIAAYFGIGDPIWVRIAFIAVTLFSAGFGLLLYGILWAIVPEAETASDRLAMKGEPVNVSNIGKIIEEKLENLTETISDIGEEFSSKKKSEVAATVTGIVTGVMGVVGKVLRAAVTVASKVFPVGLKVAGVSIIVVLWVLFLGILVGGVFAKPYFPYFLPDGTLFATVGAINIFSIIAIPLVFMGSFITRIAFRSRLSKAWRTGLSIYWGLNIMSFFLLGSFIARDFQTQASSSIEVKQLNITSDTINLEKINSMEDVEDLYVELFDDAMGVTENALLFKNVQVNIEVSDDNQFYLEKEVSARGELKQVAKDRANNIVCDPILEGNVLKLPSHLQIPKGDLWRVQEVKLTIKVPKGKYVKFGNGVHRILYGVQVKGNGHHIWKYEDETWQMQEGGLACLTCPEEVDEMSSFENVIIDGRMNVTIKYAEEYDIDIIGEDHHARIETNISNNTLYVDANHLEGLEVVIQMPLISILKTYGDSHINIQGFDDEKLKIEMKGKGVVECNSDFELLEIEQVGRSQLNLIGTYQRIEASMEDSALLNAKSASVTDLEIQLEDKSVANFDHVITVDSLVEDGSSLYIIK